MGNVNFVKFSSNEDATLFAKSVRQCGYDARKTGRGVKITIHPNIQGISFSEIAAICKNLEIEPIEIERYKK